MSITTRPLTWTNIVCTLPTFFLARGVLIQRTQMFQNIWEILQSQSLLEKLTDWGLVLLPIQLID